MAETVETVPCVAGEWTLIVDGASGAVFQWRDDAAIGKATFGATTPDPGEQDYWTVRPKAPQNFNQLSVGAKIWAMPFGEVDRIMEVITP